MKLRLILLCLTLMFAGSSALIVRLVTAQDTPPDGGMDAPVGTPRPLPTRAAFSNPARILPAGNTRLELFFPALAQGQTGLARVFKTEDTGAAIQSVRAAFLGDDITFFATDGGFFYALLAAGMEAPTGRENPLSAVVTYTDGTMQTIDANIEIGDGPYFRQIVTVPADKRYLLDADTERNELARLESLFEPVTPERMWETVGFRLPIEAELTSAFGLFRTFNGALNTRHTGWDIRTTTGQPIAAVAGGRVVFAGVLEIRGDYVVIDHGYGIYSGYAHLSQTNVQRGDRVARGAIIGMTGATGRVSGAHFHWEMAVNGDFIDGVQLISMWMP
ncbi:MAG: M23 family metallopeptidase [Chloroflexota bacterium]|nr:M23 family metallopeptidase [Chloroflexota bacterium]